MPADALIEAMQQALLLALLLAAPPLIAVALVGALSGLLQALTDIRDPALGVAPRIVVMLLAAALALPWTLEQLALFTQALTAVLPGLQLR